MLVGSMCGLENSDKTTHFRDFCVTHASGIQLSSGMPLYRVVSESESELASAAEALSRLRCRRSLGFATTFSNI